MFCYLSTEFPWCTSWGGDESDDLRAVKVLTDADIGSKVLKLDGVCMVDVTLLLLVVAVGKSS